MARPPKPAPIKFNLRLPATLHQALSDLAERQGLSVNAVCLLGLSNWVEYQQRRQPMASRVIPAPQQVRRASVSDQEPSQQRSQPAGMATVPKVGANQPCPCRSGLKYKHCHGKT